MISVCFVCLGNICRSPVAEAVFKNLIKERGVELSFSVCSRATSDWEEGNSVYPPALKSLKAHGLNSDHRSTLLTLKDVVNNDYILVMDSNNLLDVLRLTGGEFGEKIFKLCSFTPTPRDIADPWYTGDFEKAFSDISDGCNCFLDYLLREKKDAFDYDSRH